MRESVEQILAAYQGIGLTARRRGLEWHGPCPVCGGKDRWYVGPSAGGGSVMACRQCRDFRAIAGALGLNGRPPGELDTAAVERAEAERRPQARGCRPPAVRNLRQVPAPAASIPPRQGVPRFEAAGARRPYRGAGVGCGRSPVVAVHRPGAQAVPGWRPDGWRTGGDRAVRPTRAPVARRGAGDRPVCSPRPRCARRAGLRGDLLLGGRADGCPRLPPGADRCRPRRERGGAGVGGAGRVPLLDAA